MPKMGKPEHTQSLFIKNTYSRHGEQQTSYRDTPLIIHTMMLLHFSHSNILVQRNPIKSITIAKKTSPIQHIQYQTHESQDQKADTIKAHLHITH